MDKLLTQQNLLKGFTISIYVNIIAFILSVLIGVAWIYLLIGFWDWEHLLDLGIFYSANILVTLLLKKWYINYITPRTDTASLENQ